MPEGANPANASQEEGAHWESVYLAYDGSHVDAYFDDQGVMHLPDQDGYVASSDADLSPGDSQPA